MRVLYTPSFQRGLQRIERFCSESGRLPAWKQLLDDLHDIVIPNLERFPRIGPPYLDTAVESTEALMAIARLPRDAADTLRKYIHGEYIILYILGADALHLVSIRHHREALLQPQRL